MKRIAFCFDGTWNTAEMAYPTNVTRIAQSISRTDQNGITQIIHYDDGVGTGDNKRWTGWAYNKLAGAFGFGLVDNVVEAYKFLVLNYEPGDELHIFGFSRGAFTARSFVGLLRNSGVISRRSISQIRDAVDLYLSRAEGESPNSERACRFRSAHCPDLLIGIDAEWRTKNVANFDPQSAKELKICFLGVWDTVGALGVPNQFGISKLLNRKYRFHDTELSSFVERARHAVAADEKRKTFVPALWSNLIDLNQDGSGRYEQKIFPGTHSAVGGGGPVRGISDGALDWVFKGARKANLEFDLDAKSPLFGLHPDHRAQLHNEVGKFGWKIKDRLVGAGLADRSFPNPTLADLHDSTVRRRHEAADRLPEKKKYAPASLKNLWPEMDAASVVAPVRVDEGLLERKSLWENARLRAPDFVTQYTVKPYDSLAKIAEKQMGSTDLDEILLLHNQNIGALFTADELYAGQIIEIPTYVELTKA